MPPIERPTSPHLTIYRWQITTVLSIMHRFTGIALYAGAALMVYWLWSAAYAPQQFAHLHECLRSAAGVVFLLGWTFVFYYHLANGVRHLFWDAGKGYSLPAATLSGWAVVVFSFAMTAATWGFVHSSAGG